MNKEENFPTKYAYQQLVRNSQAVVIIPYNPEGFNNTNQRYSSAFQRWLLFKEVSIQHKNFFLHENWI